jgi:NADH-quinone oxidoreductase subunit C
MNPSLEQLAEQFNRLVTNNPVRVAPVVAPVAAGAGDPGTAATTTAKPGSATPATPAPAATPPPPPPAPPPPVQTVDFSLKGFHLDVTVLPAQVVAAAEILDHAGFGMDAVTGVDWLVQNEMEVVYDYFHPTSPLRIVVRTRIPRANPELPTISGVFPGANWHERETHDFFGIRFTGHPNLKPFLLPEDAEFHPLLKDYKP